MFPLKQVLFPVDFSTNSINAARYAAALACRFHAELTVLNVVAGHTPYEDVNDVCLSPGLAIDIAWNEMREKDAKLKMEQFVGAHLHGVRAKASVLRGDPAKVIVDLAQDLKTDLLVMPTHGFGGFRRMLLGSTAAKVLHDVNCPVFTSAHLVSGPVYDVPFRTILCAVDLGARSEPVMHWAKNFARQMDAELTVLHVTPEIVAGQWGYCDTDLEAAMRGEATARLNGVLDSSQTQAEIIVESGAVVNTVRALAASKAADLVVIGRHCGTGILGRLRDTAYGIIRESPCPVVSV
jgi:nucleotide-binding universal stress UspA family protein